MKTFNTVAGGETFVGVIAASAVGMEAVENIRANAAAIRSKAMQLTDSWEGVMFALSKQELENIAAALGFDRSVARQIHAEICALEYAHAEGRMGRSSLATYHSLDVSLLAVRGVTDFDTAMSEFGDHNLQAVIEENQDTFQRVRAALPEHAARMNFKPETAAEVLSALGASVSANLLYDLAPKYETTSIVDIEGRRGVSVEFIRCVTLTLGSSL